jgi:hypothetical protein
VELKTLWSETERAYALEGNQPYLVAKKVVIAAREDILYTNLPFCNDPPGDPVPDTDHVTVCKPTETRKKPLVYLLRCLLED